MKVVMFTDIYSPHVSSLSYNLETARLYLKDIGIDVFVICPRYFEDIKDPMVLQIEGEMSNYFVGVKNAKLDRKNKQIIKEAIKAYSPDLVHIVTNGSIGRYGRKLFKNSRTPILSSSFINYDRYADYNFGSLTSSAIKYFIWKYLKRAFKDSRAIIVPSNFWKKKLEEHGISPVNVWTPGVDTKLFNPYKKKNSSLRTKIGVTQDTVLFLYVGSLTKESNLELVLQAWDRCYDKMPNSRLVVVGNGPYEKNLMNMSIPNITWINEQSRAEVAQIYADCDVFVYPPNNQVFSNQILEAMASGIPIIMTESGFNSEMVGESNLAYLLPDLDSTYDWSFGLQMMYADTSVRHMMSVNAMKHVYDKYKLDYKIEELSKIYKLCLYQKK